jgi:tetratricopeptide (TPR) repeat protein
VPTLPEALTLAEEALAAGNLERADFIYRQILEAVPDEPQALFGLGRVAVQEGNLITAEDYFNRVIGLYPNELAIYHQLFQVLRSQNRAGAAADCCRRALAVAPQAAEFRNCLGIALKDQERWSDAIVSFEEAIASRPDYADAHYNLANTLSLAGQVDRAEHAYHRAMELAPADFEPPNNLGTLLRRQGRFDEALSAYDLAIECQADAAEPRRNRASLRLLLGDYAGGWPEYEWRWRMPGTSAPKHSEPRWQGEPLVGKTLLLCAEQGFGDTIQFVRYARPLHDRGARVVVECARPLHELLKTAPGIDALCEPGIEHEACDYFIPLLSVPAVLGTTLETIPTAVPYLFAQPERVARWRHELSGSGLKIGIAWQGSRGFKDDANRSAPLKAFEPLVQTGARLYSLQKGFGSEQLQAVGDAWGIVDLGKTLDEGTGAFVDTAAVMQCLDLVVTTDTAIAHVAGAIGARTWVALQHVPNWRWLLDRDDSPWYPTMRLFRQTTLGDWNGVFERIAAAAASLVKPRRSEGFSVEFD